MGFIIKALQLLALLAKWDAILAGYEKAKTLVRSAIAKLKKN